MSNEELVAATNAAIFFLFFGLMLVGAMRTIVRAGSYRRKGITLEPILKRDLIAQTGLTWPFLMILFARMTGNAPAVAGQLWWSLITGIPAIIAVATYTYFELFVIDRETTEDRLTRIERKIDENTKVSTDAFHEANGAKEQIQITNKNIEETLGQADRRDKRAEETLDELKDQARQAVVDRVEEHETVQRGREAGRKQMSSMRESVDETRREVGDLHRDRFPESDDEPVINPIEE